MKHCQKTHICCQGGCIPIGSQGINMPHDWWAPKWAILVLYKRDPHFKEPFSVYTQEMYKCQRRRKLQGWHICIKYTLTGLSIYNPSFCKQFAAWSSRFCVLIVARGSKTTRPEYWGLSRVVTSKISRFAKYFWTFKCLNCETVSSLNFRNQ